MTDDYLVKGHSKRSRVAASPASGGFVGLDLGVTSSYGAGSGPVLFDRIRKDTGGFVNVGTLFTAPAGTALVVTAEAEGDWEMDLMVKFYTDDDPTNAGVSICVNDCSVQVIGANFTARDIGTGAPLGNDLIIAGWTAYGLVAGDVVWCSFGIDTTAEINMNTYVRFRYLGPAS